MSNQIQNEIKEIYVSTIAELYNFCSKFTADLSDRILKLHFNATSIEGCLKSILNKEGGKDMLDNLHSEIEMFKQSLSEININTGSDIQKMNKQLLSNCSKIKRIDVEGKNYEWSKNIYENLLKQISYFFNALLAVVQMADPLGSYIRKVTSRSGNIEMKSAAEVDRWHKNLAEELNKGNIQIKNLGENLKKIEKYAKVGNEK